MDRTIHTHMFFVPKYRHFMGQIVRETQIWEGGNEAVKERRGSVVQVLGIHVASRMPAGSRTIL